MSFSTKNGIAVDDLLATANNALRDGVVEINPSNEKVLTNWSLKPNTQHVSEIRKDVFSKLTTGLFAAKE